MTHETPRGNPEYPGSSGNTEHPVEGTLQRDVAARAAAVLENAEIDIQALAKKHAQIHRRWGITDALIRMGYLSDEKEYTDQLRQTSLGEKNKIWLAESQQRGFKFPDLIVPPALTPSELVKILFEDAGIPYRVDQDLDLDTSLVVCPKDFSNVTGLGKLPKAEQTAAFEDAYKTAFEREKNPTPAQLIFTESGREVSRSGTSASEDVELMAGGADFLDLRQDLVRVRLHLDEALQAVLGTSRNIETMNQQEIREGFRRMFKGRIIQNSMPDTLRSTHHPAQVFPDGRTSTLYWSGGLQLLIISARDPFYKDASLGSRVRVA